MREQPRCHAALKCMVEAQEEVQVKQNAQVVQVVAVLGMQVSFAQVVMVMQDQVSKELVVLQVVAQPVVAPAHCSTNQVAGPHEQCLTA